MTMKKTELIGGVDRGTAYLCAGFLKGLATTNRPLDELDRELIAKAADALMAALNIIYEVDMSGNPPAKKEGAP